MAIFGPIVTKAEIEFKNKSERGVYLIIYEQEKIVYIGESDNISDRWKAHIKQLNNGCHHNDMLQSYWNLYSANNFVFRIVQNTNNKLESLGLEYFTIQKYINLGYIVCNHVQNRNGFYPDRCQEKCYSMDKVIRYWLITRDILEQLIHIQIIPITCIHVTKNQIHIRYYEFEQLLRDDIKFKCLWYLIAINSAYRQMNNIKNIFDIITRAPEPIKDVLIEYAIRQLKYFRLMQDMYIKIREQ